MTLHRSKTTPIVKMKVQKIIQTSFTLILNKSNQRKTHQLAYTEELKFLVRMSSKKTHKHWTTTKDKQ